ncbi:hypothetical protein [Chondrinema litorale]|uniref:hypothetical protein n=1 Tax=Chondrinema litorale TaxID=2994555 RepID=UPI002543A413|nr:hypothetical protein [Chondrinema litorale]UZR99433.1 hypothetical protein OQ292_36810 [Chondrinema litorale]
MNISTNLLFPIKKQKLLLMVLMVGFCTKILAQSDEVIYFPDSRPTKISTFEINSSHVKYKAKNNSTGQYSHIFKQDIMMAFYPLGTYHVYSETQKDLVSVNYSSPSNDKIDKLLTKDGNVIAAEINTVETQNTPNKIVYKDTKTGSQGNIAQSDLSIILYKDGKYQLFDLPSEVAKVLLKASDDVLAVSNPSTENNNTVPETTIPENTTPDNNFPEDGHISDNVIIDDDPNLSNVDTQLFRDKALAKTRELEDYLTLVANKKTPFQKANDAIDAAVKLFIDEKRMMEVSSVNRTDVTKYKLRTYFEKLKLLKYDEVRVSWSDISYVSKIEKGEDGNFYGIVTFQQKFEGFIDGNLEYSDITKKNITVILKTYDKYIEGEKTTLWDVYLGDIGVVNTKY